MKALYNSQWHTRVRVAGQESITSETTLLATEMECSVSLLVSKKTFLIKNACWEIYRGGKGPVSLEINELAGVEAYFGAGPALRRSLSGSPGEEALPLVTESVRGIIQAETYLFRERGFKDSRSYDEYWNTMYANSCRYYSNLDRVSVQWEEHIGGQQRFGTLYNKFKAISVSEGEDSLQATASMADSFHEVSISARLDKKTGALSSAGCRLLRGPDPVCAEAAEFTHNLLGKRLAGMNKKELAKYLASSQGCVHIIDTWRDLSLVLTDICRNMST